MSMPRFLQRKPADEGMVRASEARVLDALTDAIDKISHRLDVLERKVGALHLGSTCHPEWVAPSETIKARIQRALIVESVLASQGSDEGMTVRELAAYLHLPPSRFDTLREDLRFLDLEERVQRLQRHRWRIRSEKQHAPQDR